MLYSSIVTVNFGEIIETVIESCFKFLVIKLIYVFG